MEIKDHIQGILNSLPKKPGCYLMKNEAGKIIYVGKAINLRARVRSYFHDSAQHSPKTIELVKKDSRHRIHRRRLRIRSLILEEMTLIKKHMPRYNVRLKDDKRYPYIKVHWGDPFPKVTVTRNMLGTEDGSRYFGPYTSVWAVHRTLDVLRKIFPFLTCDRDITGLDTRACLYYDIKLCNGPCIGKVNQEEYRQMISDLMDFLNGRSESITDHLTQQMHTASEKLMFEKAAAIRDQLKAIENIVEKQRVFSLDYADSDVIAMARSEREACIQVFFIRNGRMIGREYFMMEGANDTNDEEVLTEFVKQFYEKAASIPDQLLLPKAIEEANIIRSWLNNRTDKKIKINIPKRGQKKDLINMATENATETLSSLRQQWEQSEHHQAEGLAELQEAFKLNRAPFRIECYDISTTQGTATVGSMVVFERGVANKKHYRRFNIKTIEGPDDFGSMEEVLRRRFNRWLSAQEQKDTPGKKNDESFSKLPDLLIVDGGKGQLSRAIKVLDEFNLLDTVPVAGLAKQNEELFLPGASRSILLPRRSQGLYMLQRLRDEAHRFAITAHRKKRSKQGLASRLDSIPGIGPAKRKALLIHFGDIKAIENASIEELEQVKGVNTELASSIKLHLE